MSRMDRYHGQDQIRVKNINIKKAAIKILAGGLVLVALSSGVNAVIEGQKPKYDPAFSYSSEYRNRPSVELSLVDEYNAQRLKEFNENGIKFNKFLYEMLYNKYYVEGRDLTKTEARTFYDQELLLVEHQKELLATDTSEFDPFRYIYYTLPAYMRNELTNEEMVLLAKYQDLKEAYDFQRLSVLKVEDFNVDLFGKLDFQKMEKTLLDEEAKTLYDLELLKPEFDKRRAVKIDMTYNTNKRDRSNDLLHKYVTNDITPEEYRELYDLLIVRNRFESLEESRNRGK